MHITASFDYDFGILVLSPVDVIQCIMKVIDDEISFVPKNDSTCNRLQGYGDEHERPGRDNGIGRTKECNILILVLRPIMRTDKLTKVFFTQYQSLK